MRKFQKIIISFFTFIGGFYFFLEFILPQSIGGIEFGAYHEQILKGVKIIGIMAIGLGLISIIRVHSKNIFNQRTGWINSLALLLGFIFAFGFQIGNFFEERNVNLIKKRLELSRKFITVIDNEKDTKSIIPRLDALNQELGRIQTESYFKDAQDISSDFIGLQSKIKSSSVNFTEKERQEIDSQFALLTDSVSTLLDQKVQISFFKRAVDLFNKGLFEPLGSAMFALLAFYIANAAYRSFRIRSLESFLLMVAAVIVMLGQIPQGPIYIYSDLPSIRLWLIEYISTPAFRAIFFGSFIAGLAMAIRIWLSLERGPLDDSTEVS